MEAKTLNFVDAMELAKIMSKYNALELIHEKTYIVDFVSELFDKISVSDLGTLLTLFYGDSYTESCPEDLVQNLIDSLSENKLESLLMFYQSEWK